MLPDANHTVGHLSTSNKTSVDSSFEGPSSELLNGNERETHGPASVLGPKPFPGTRCWPSAGLGHSAARPRSGATPRHAA